MQQGRAKTKKNAEIINLGKYSITGQYEKQISKGIIIMMKTQSNRTLAKAFN